VPARTLPPIIPSAVDYPSGSGQASRVKLERPRTNELAREAWSAGLVLVDGRRVDAARNSHPPPEAPCSYL
jgi:hypothetical protein